MFSLTKQTRKETAPVPISSSSSETLTPGASECELISTVDSLSSSSSGITKPAIQDSIQSTPPSAYIAGEVTTTPLTVSTGSGKLTADAPEFIPRCAPSTVVSENTPGEEVDLRKLGAPMSLTVAASNATPTPMPEPMSKATDEEEEKKRKRLATILEVRRRAEEEVRKKREEEEAATIAEAKIEEEERKKKEEEAVKVKAEEEAKLQAEADTEKDALMKRIQEQEAELALLKAKLAAQSQPLQVQPLTVPPSQEVGSGEDDQDQVMSSTDDTGSVIYSENAVQHEEPEAEEEESQEEKEQKKDRDWSADHPREVEPSYFPITPGPLTSPAGTFSVQQQVPGQPLQKMGRERSRRGGRRDRNRTANADKGEKGHEATDPLKLQKSRSHEPQKRPTLGKLDLSTMQRSRSVHPALPSSLSSAKNITDITIVVYPAGVRSPKAELNAQSPNGPFRCVLFFLSVLLKVWCVSGKLIRMFVIGTTASS